MVCRLSCAVVVQKNQQNSGEASSSFLSFLTNVKEKNVVLEKTFPVQEWANVSLEKRFPSLSTNDT